MRRDGLDFYRRLAAESRLLLKPGGKLMVEFAMARLSPSAAC